MKLLTLWFSEFKICFYIDHKSAISFPLSQKKITFFAATCEMEKPMAQSIHPEKRINIHCSPDSSWSSFLGGSWKRGNLIQRGQGEWEKMKYCAPEL
jgi:hypothetical protein